MRASILILVALIPAFAQPPAKGGGPGSEALRQATQLDVEGKYDEARAVLQKAIDTAATPAAKAAAQRSMAMSWAFEGNCKKTAEYEEMVIAYWKTQETEAPGNAYYQQGEMANEAARVCIESGELMTAFDYYKRGRELGQKEPNISEGRKALWDFRWEHALARIAARRGQKELAAKHVAAAKGILRLIEEKDAALGKQQAAFFPYLTGYVALHTGDYKKAIEDLSAANPKDPFYQCMIGMAYAKLGDKEKASEYFKNAAATRGHNPPAAFAHYYTKKVLKGQF